MKNHSESDGRDLLASVLTLFSDSPDVQSAELALFEKRRGNEAAKAPNVQEPFVDLAEGLASLLHQLSVSAGQSVTIAGASDELRLFLEDSLETRRIIFSRPEDHWTAPDWENIRRMAGVCLEGLNLGREYMSVWDLLCYISD